MLGLGMSTSSPAAVSASAQATIRRHVDSVFGFVARDFFANYQTWCPQVVELEPNGATAAQRGVQARQVTLDRGIRSEATFEIVAFEAPSRLVLEGRSEPFLSSYQFEPTSGESTELTFNFEMKQLELSMRPFAKLIRAAIQEGAEQTVENLKRILESQAPRAEPAARVSAAS